MAESIKERILRRLNPSGNADFPVLPPRALSFEEALRKKMPWEGGFWLLRRDDLKDLGRQVDVSGGRKRPLPDKVKKDISDAFAAFNSASGAAKERVFEETRQYIEDHPELYGGTAQMVGDDKIIAEASGAVASEILAKMSAELQPATGTTRGPEVDVDIQDDEDWGKYGYPPPISVKSFEDAVRLIKKHLNADVDIEEDFPRPLKGWARAIRVRAAALAEEQNIDHKEVVALTKWINSRIHAKWYWHEAWNSPDGVGKAFDKLVGWGKQFTGEDIVTILSDKDAVVSFHEKSKEKGYFKSLTDLGSPGAIFGKIVQRVTGVTELATIQQVPAVDVNGDPILIVDERGRPKQLTLSKADRTDYEWGRNAGFTEYIFSEGYKAGYPFREYLLDLIPVGQLPDGTVVKKLIADRGDCYVTDMWHYWDKAEFWLDNYKLIGAENQRALGCDVGEVDRYLHLQTLENRAHKEGRKAEEWLKRERGELEKDLVYSILQNIRKLDIHGLADKADRQNFAGLNNFLDWSNPDWKAKWNFNRFPALPLVVWNQSQKYIMDTRIPMMEMLGKLKKNEMLSFIEFLTTENAYRHMNRGEVTHFRDEAQAYWNNILSVLVYQELYERRKTLDSLTFAAELNSWKVRGFEKNFDVDYLFKPCRINKDWTTINSADSLTSSEKVRLVLQDWGTYREYWEQGWLADKGITFEAFVAFAGWKWENGRYLWDEDGSYKNQHLTPDQLTRINNFMQEDIWRDLYDWKELKHIECKAMWKYLARRFDDNPLNRHDVLWGPEIDFRKRDWFFWEEGFRKQQYSMVLDPADADKFIYDQVDQNGVIIEGSGLDNAGRLWTGTMARYPGDSRRYTPRLPFWDEDVWLDMDAGIYSAGFWGEAADKIGMSWEGEKLYLLVFGPDTWYNPDSNTGILARLGPAGSGTLDKDTTTFKMIRYGAEDYKVRKFLHEKSEVRQPDYQGKVMPGPGEQDVKSLMQTVASLTPGVVKSLLPIPGIRSMKELGAVLKGAGVGTLVVGGVLLIFAPGMVPVAIVGTIGGALLAVDRGDNVGEGISTAVGGTVGLLGERINRRSRDAYLHDPDFIGDCAIDDKGMAERYKGAKDLLGKPTRDRLKMGGK